MENQGTSVCMYACVQYPRVVMCVCIGVCVHMRICVCMFQPPSVSQKTLLYDDKHPSCP